MKKSFLLINIFLLTSCNIGINTIKTYNSYIDNHITTIDNIDFNFSHDIKKSTINDSYNISIDVEMVSHNTKPQNLLISDAYFERLSDGAIYKSVLSSFNKEINLECDLKTSRYFSRDIPTDINQDNYAFNLVCKDFFIKYNLFLKDNTEKYTVKYYVNNSLVNTSNFKYGDSLSSYVWENNIKDQYCDKWSFKDQYSHDYVPEDFVITENFSLYGFSQSSYDFTSFQSDKYSYLTKINHEPSNGIVVLPKKSFNKDICISHNAICNSKIITTIYFPSTIIKIYAGNFVDMPNLKNIYYAGTQEQWNKLMADADSKIPSNVRVKVNTSYPNK